VQVVGDKPSWGDTTGSTENSPVMCCDRVDFSPQWSSDVERTVDFPESTNSYTWQYFDPQYIFQNGWLRADSYYVASVHGVTFDCTHNVKGIYHTLDLPESFGWTDYSVEFRGYSGYTMFGILFRFQVCGTLVLFWCRLCVAVVLFMLFFVVVGNVSVRALAPTSRNRGGPFRTSYEGVFGTVTSVFPPPLPAPMCLRLLPPSPTTHPVVSLSGRTSGTTTAGFPTVTATARRL
jgi:hypothetical protein